MTSLWEQRKYIAAICSNQDILHAGQAALVPNYQDLNGLYRQRNKECIQTLSEKRKAGRKV